MIIRRPIPNTGWVLSSQDFKAGELVTHAQSTLWLVGHSDLAVALLNKIDPHAAFACTMLGIELKDFDKKIRAHALMRQAGKPFNFSKPGGGGDATIVMQQRKQGEDTPHPEGPSMIEDADGNLVPGYKGMRFCTVMQGVRCGVKADGSPNKTMYWGKRGRERKLEGPTCIACLECANYLGETWKRQWSENPHYFKFISNTIDNGMTITAEALDRWPWLKEVYRPGQQTNPAQVMQHFTGTLRTAGAGAETPFCVLSNGFFQVLLAVITKMAHRIVTRECYVRTRVPDMLFANSLRSEFAGIESPLFGSRVPLFAHDELLCEHPESMGHEGATRCAEVQRDVMRYVCPDLADAVEVDPTLMPSWFKSASKVVHNGRLVPWTPDHNEKKCPECIAEKSRVAARAAAQQAMHAARMLAS